MPCAHFWNRVTKLKNRPGVKELSVQSARQVETSFLNVTPRFPIHLQVLARVPSCSLAASSDYLFNVHS